MDGPSDGKTWLNRWRIKDITTESGSLVGVIYADTECTLATVPDPHLNDMRCFPQWYSGGAGEPTLDWFHRYVVESVLVDDLTGASPRMETHWDYLDDPAWHYDDSELVAEDKRTWAQWRGYSQVRVRQGSASGTQSATEYLFMRGMDGDRASPSGGTKSVQITDSQGVSITDHEAHAGFLRESIVYNGVGGAWVSGEINDPWRHGPTATAGPQTATFDALDRQTTTTYSPPVDGPVTSVTETNPLGHATTLTMEPAWQLPTRTVDANGFVTDLTYDGMGRLTDVWLPGRDQATQSPSLEFDYLVRNDAPSAATTRTLLPTGADYRTSITLFDSELRQRQTQLQAPGGGRTITDTFYDSRGLTVRVAKEYYDDSNAPPDTTLVGPAGQSEKCAPDNPKPQVNALHTTENRPGDKSQAWRTTYAYGGDRLHMTPPDGGTATTKITDARGQVTALRQYHGPTPTGSYDEVTYGYTERGELATVSDAAGNTWAYEYDQRGREISATDPDAGTTTKTYDAAGQLITTTDGRGQMLGYTYDDLGRRTSIRDASPTGAKRAEWVYDTLTNGIGNLTRSIRHHDGAQYVSEVVGYDPAGRPTGSRVIIPAAETGLDGTYETTPTYNPDGSLSAVELPAAGGLPTEELIYGYDDVGNQTWISSGLSVYVGTVVYGKLSRLTQRQLGNFGKRVSITRQYDEPTGRLVNMSAVPENKPEVVDRAYEYDDAGNVTRIADSPGSSDPIDTQCFRYDHLRRMTDAWTPASTAWWNCLVNPQVGSLGGVAPYWHSWTYDPTGNRLTETQHATGGDTVSTYEYPVAGSPRPHAVTGVDTTGPGGSTSNSYVYDEAGNLTERTIDGVAQDLTFDAEGQVAEVTEGTVTSTFIYDADGNRLIRRDPDGKTLYLDGQEVRWDASSGIRSCTRYYAHLGTAIAVRTSAGVAWMVTDHHNTGVVAVRESDMQAVVRRSLPFGGQRGAAPAWWAGDKGFVGGTQDPSGLVHLGARLYDTDLGRFISVDPIMDLADPHQMHGYAYTVARALAMKHCDLDESLIHSLTRMTLAIAAAAVLTARYQAGRPSPPAQPTRPGSGRSGTAPNAPRLRPIPHLPFVVVAATRPAVAPGCGISCNGALVGAGLLYGGAWGTAPLRTVM